MKLSDISCGDGVLNITTVSETREVWTIALLPTIELILQLENMKLVVHLLETRGWIKSNI